MLTGVDSVCRTFELILHPVLPRLEGWPREVIGEGLRGKDLTEIYFPKRKTGVSFFPNPDADIIYTTDEADYYSLQNQCLTFTLFRKHLLQANFPHFPLQVASNPPQSSFLQ